MPALQLSCCTPGRAQVSVLVPEMQAAAISSPAVSLVSVWVTACGSQHLVMYSICMEELLLSLDSIIANWGEIALFIWKCAWDYFNGFCRDLILPILCFPSRLPPPLTCAVPCSGVFLGVPSLPVARAVVVHSVTCSTEHLAAPACRAQALGAPAWHCWCAEMKPWQGRESCFDFLGCSQKADKERQL